MAVGRPSDGAVLTVSLPRMGWYQGYDRDLHSKQRQQQAQENSYNINNSNQKNSNTFIIALPKKHNALEYNNMHDLTAELYLYKDDA